MYHPAYLTPVDYLVVGHITRDLAEDGERLGGTATYAALTAQRLGLRVGILTSRGDELPLGPLEEIPTVNLPSHKSTAFENRMTERGREQILYDVASSLDLFMIPETWRNPSIIHFGPVAQEVEPTLLRHFNNSFIGVTPQGWLRTWDEGGRVSPCEWPEANFVLRQAGAVVISIEDVGGDEDRIEEMAASCRVLGVTEHAKGARLYWHGDVRRFPAPQVKEVDSTGAGDIFAAAFFIRLFTTRDPWEAARFATQLASWSVTRPGLEGIPTPEEIEDCMVEVLH